MSEKSERLPRGRPRSIDRAAVLARATETFWRLGYEGASLSELTAAMGVSRPTLYTAYGDKADLFMAALEQYGGTYGTAPLRAFLAEAEIGTAVSAFLRIAAEGNTTPGMPTGCLIACCASTAAESQPAVRDRLAEIAEQTAAALAERFSTEVTAGRLSAEPGPFVRAQRLIDMMYAQAVRARSGETRASLMADLASRVTAVVGRPADVAAVKTV
ncbi:MAG: TetR/AcrR family transcriptional regulator [Pseudomonadota bacterium]